MKDSISFLARRLKRLEPPYFACILLVIFLNHLSSLSPGFQGKKTAIDWGQLLAHVGYLNTILNYPWLNPVFWTLAIEFQYYFFMAFAFPLISHTKQTVRIASILAISAVGLFGGNHTALLFHWLPLFSIGVLTFQYYTNHSRAIVFVILLAISSCISFICVGLPHTIVGIITALTILFFNSRPIPRVFWPLLYFGTISYSLYLVHTVVGGKVINLANRLPESVLYRYPAIILAMVISILAAHFFWRLVERPAQRWASDHGIIRKSPDPME
jgi:peptidoglycan/LPS O-acetylase OafA/YrhL